MLKVEVKDGEPCITGNIEELIELCEAADDATCGDWLVLEDLIDALKGLRERLVDALSLH